VTASGGARAGRVAHGLALLLASLGVWAALAAVPLLPTNDGPEHIMMGHIENHYDDEDTVYRHFLAPAPQYAGRGFAALFVPLEPLLGWRAAYRTTVLILLLGWSWGFAALALALEPRRRWLGLLGFATAFQWTVYMGFFAFVAGSACGLWLIALGVATERFTARRLFILGLGLLLQGFLHVFSALLTAAVLALVIAARGSAGERARSLLRFAAAALPLSVLFLLTLRDQATAALIANASETQYVPIVEKLRFLHRCFQPGHDGRGLLMVVAAAVGLLMVLLPRRRPVERALALAATALLLAALLGPDRVPGWQFFYQRFLPLGLMLAVALLAVERLPLWGRVAVALSAAAFCASSLMDAATVNRKLYQRNADVYSGLDQPISRHGLRLTIGRDPWFALPPSRSPIPGMVPLNAVGGLFIAAQGGMSPYMFIDSPSVHEFVGRDRAWEEDFPIRPPPDSLQKVAHLPPQSPQRIEVVDGLALAGTGYEDVVLVSSPSDAELLRQRGYATDYQRGDLFLGHFVGCSVELQLPPLAGASAVEYGFWPRTDAPRRLALGPATPAADGSLRVVLPGAPCGPIFIRVVSIAGACRGADADGRLRLEVPAGQPATVRCELAGS
jgi:hypothetical protein